jgi:hypothetical protein
MKNLFLTVVAALLLTACSNEKKADESSGTTGENKETSAAKTDYAYKAEYSPEFSMGDAGHSKMVLDLYKMWEDGKIDDMRPLLADSVFIDIYDGNKFNNTLDSFINFAKQVRTMYKSTRPVFDTWMPVHHKESGEDYVLVWNRDYSTSSDDKSDSIRVHAYFQIKNNKVRGWSEFQQKLAPPPAVK